MVERVTNTSEQLRPVTQERFRAPDISGGGEAIGRAVQGLGEQIGVLAKTHEEVQERYDKAAVRKADAEDALKISEIRAKALAAEGFDAQAAITDADQQIEEIKKARMTSLGNGRQQRLYGDIFNQRLAQVKGDFVTHGIKEVDKAERGAAGARAEASQTIAIDSFDNPEMFNSNVATMKAEIAAANRGAGPDAIGLAQRKAVSNTHLRVIDTLMSDPDKIDQADAWVTAHAADLTPEDETKARKLLRPLLDEQQGQADLGMILSGGTAPPDDGEDDAAAPTPAVPRQQGEPVKDVFSHVVGGKGGKISSGFGSRAAPTKGASTNHGGVDIPAPQGSPIRPPMSGRVLDKGFDAKHGGGWYVLIQHPNGMVTGYAHMRGESPLKKDDDVDSTTQIGSVGMSGTATGPHLHFTVRKSPGGAKIDPQTVDWTAVASSGGPKTVDPKSVKWKEGDLIKVEADKDNLGDLLNRTYDIAKANNWSQSRYNNAVKAVREHAGLQRQLYQQNYDSFKDGVWAKIAGLDGGDGLTSVAQLGGDFGRLEGPDQLTVQNLIQANKKRASGEGEGKANSDTYLTYAEMSQTPALRKEFLSMDFRADPNITKGERARLTMRQRALRNDENGSLAAHIDRIHGVVNRYAPQGGFATKPNMAEKEKSAASASRQLLIDRTTQLVDAKQKDLGRPLTDVEMDAIVRSQVVSIVRHGPGGDVEMPLYKARRTPKKAGEVDSVRPTETLNNIPPVVKSRIIEGLQRRGIPVTPRNIIEVYLEGSK
jgi:murein DD-endopeptidase MepM/ murein hydrolase activator NlpD